jgi:hypothetical protein
MSKYYIENNIDFYTELHNSLGTEDLEDYHNVCLITNEPLTDKHVVMECGHKFNYIPIYNDTIHHKHKFNTLESGNSKVNMNQIRCPYCRNKQYTLLPYYEELGLAKVHGVNFYDPSIEHPRNYYTKQCQYKFPNEHFNPNIPESDTNSRYLTNMKCSLYYAKPHCIKYGDINVYCYQHKNIMAKYYKAIEKQKAKLAIDEVKALKLKAKEHDKAVKELEKRASKKKPIENVVLGSSNVLQSSEGCIAVLKSGPNKGALCGCKIKSENMCFRHFAHSNNIII